LLTPRVGAAEGPIRVALPSEIQERISASRDVSFNEAKAFMLRWSGGDIEWISVTSF
jgi:hypothetical protein